MLIKRIEVRGYDKILEYHKKLKGNFIIVHRKKQKNAILKK
jgi:hypothetical protein